MALKSLLAAVGLAALGGCFWTTTKSEGEALRRDLRTYNGDPVGCLLDYTLDHFERLREFWREAARAWPRSSSRSSHRCFSSSTS